MLVLTRSVGEQIILSDGDIRIVVQAIKGKRVSIGIEAEGDIRVLRGEILQRIAREVGHSTAVGPNQVQRRSASRSAAVARRSAS